MTFKEFQQTKKEASSFTPPLKYEETGEVIEGYVYGDENRFYPHEKYGDSINYIDHYLHIFKYKVSDLKPDVIEAYEFAKDEGYFN